MLTGKHVGQAHQHKIHHGVSIAPYTSLFRPPLKCFATLGHPVRNLLHVSMYLKTELCVQVREYIKQF